jgi:pyruvate dehydrogenase E1 component
MNHSALLTADQIADLRSASGLTPDNEWDRFPEGGPEDRLLAAARSRLERAPPRPAGRVVVPRQLPGDPPARASTQEAVGRLLLGLSREGGIAERLVTISPDVSVSTNLGGWINKVGVFGLEEEPVYEGPDAQPLAWSVSPAGRHIELGISEMNLFLALGQLGMTAEYQGERLFPIGTLYDPFVVRGLEALVYGAYSGSRFVVLGTPSGVSLSREGGAHQSIITPGIGIEQPGLSYCEPAFARELEWLLLDGLDRMQEDDGDILYLRLTTKPVHQAPFAELCARRGEEAVRADVLAGAYWLRDPAPGGDAVVLATCGAMVPEVLVAAEQLLSEEGVSTGVLCVSSPGRLYRDWRHASLVHIQDLAAIRRPSHLEALVPPAVRGMPFVTVIDGASHALAWIGSAIGTRTIPLGVDRFGQVGSQPAVYDAYGISPDAIVTAALIALEP